jgi:hypothetical protein
VPPGGRRKAATGSVSHDGRESAWLHPPEGGSRRLHRLDKQEEGSVLPEAAGNAPSIALKSVAQVGQTFSSLA